MVWDSPVRRKRREGDRERQGNGGRRKWEGRKDGGREGGREGRREKG